MIKAGNIIELLKQTKDEMDRGVYDFTRDGKCSGCGNCCTNLLPMSQKEVDVIRKYVKENHIREARKMVPLAKPALDLNCPFLDMGKREKCQIYSVRPAICRAFICSDPEGAKKCKELYDEIRSVINVRKEFFE